MSYSLYDQDGWVGPVATAHGWKSISGILHSLGGDCALLESQGYTTEPADAAAGAKQKLPELSRLLGECHGIAIISDSYLEGSGAARKLSDVNSDHIIYVARHGKTEDDDKGIASGWRNVDLNKEGQGEAEHLAHQLTGLGIAEIYSSDLDRTMDTAHIIAARIKAKVIPLLGLRSWHHGGEGLPEDKAKEIIAKGIEHPASPPVPGAESRDDMAQRFADSLRKVVERQKAIKKPVLIVTHSWNAGLIPLTLTGADQSKVKPLEPGHAEKLVYDGKEWDVESLQDTLPSPYLVNGPTMPLAAPEPHARSSPVPSGDPSDRAVIVKMSDLPEHCDFAGCAESLDGHGIMLKKLITSSIKAKIIKALVMQAVAQIRRGAGSIDLQFSNPMGIEHKLAPSIEAIKSEAATHAQQEIKRMTRGQVHV